MAIQPIGLPDSVAFGEGFELDLRPRRLRRGSRVLKLERIPLEILLLLVEHPGEVVTRDQIVTRVWGRDVFLDTDNSIRGAIRKIRYVLKDDPEQPRFIQTVTGQGYRFIARITVGDRPGMAGSDSTAAAVAKASLAAPEHVQPTATQEAEGRERTASRSRWLVPALASGLLLATAIALVIARTPLSNTAPPQVRSLAVLPLRNMSGDPGQEYLADQMTEEIIGRLATIRDLRVISRTSVMQFKDPKQTIPDIAKALGVEAIVEGSVIRDQNHIRVHAQLIRAANDEHFWSETYDRDVGDILALESEVAQAIAQRVSVTVSGQEHAMLASKRKVSPEAYESYLKGIYTSGNTKAGIEKSVALFQDAINKDPTFAPAYLGLANAYGLLGTVYAGVPPEETRPKLMRAAQNALELDPGLTGAHVLLAQTYQRLWMWRESGEEYKRALDLEPNNTEAIRGSALWLICEGRTEEGVARLERARELDPMNVSGLVDDGFNLFLARHYDESIQVLRSALAVKPEDAFAHWFLGYALIAKGQPQQAIPELERAVQLSDRSAAVIGVLIRAYAHAGRRADALRMLEELKRRSKIGYVPAGAFINAYLGLGDNEQAFQWLEKGYKEKSGIMPLLKSHPHFDPIRNDPRFVDLIHRVGLDQQIP